MEVERHLGEIERIEDIEKRVIEITTAGDVLQQKREAGTVDDAELVKEQKEPDEKVKNVFKLRDGVKSQPDSRVVENLNLIWNKVLTKALCLRQRSFAEDERAAQSSKKHVSGK